MDQSGPAAMPLTPRLLEGLQNTLTTFAPELGERGRHSLQAALVIVNELMLREDRGFFADLYGEVRRLATEAAKALPPGSLIPGGDLPDALDDRHAYDVSARSLERGFARIDAIIKALGAAGRAEAADGIRQQALALETRFHAHRTETLRPVISGKSDVTIPSADELQVYLDDRFPERGLRITSFRELVGGYQKKTILFETVDAAGVEEGFVVRAEKEKPFLVLDCGTVPREFSLVSHLYAAGLPVAEPMWLEEDASRLGTRFMVSRRLPGASMGSAIAAGHLQENTARELVATLARIHQLPIGDTLLKSPIGHWAAYPTLAENTRANIGKWWSQPYMHRGETSIALSWVYEWLVANVPTDDAPARFLHVDYGPHNILAADGHISGVVDWESARIGDPAEDLGYMMQNFQGQFEREKVIGWYRDAGGDAISEYRLRYFDVFASLKMLVGPMSAASFYEHNRDASIDWCVMALLYGKVNRAVAANIAAAEAAR